MVQTRNSENNNPPDPIATQLAGIAAKLEIDFSIFSGGDPRGWLLKAEKYFRCYQIPDEEKAEIASMHLERDALDLYSWLSDGQVIFWEELVQAFTKNFGPAEFQNPHEFLCSIKQTRSVQEYRQEFTKRSSRVSNWPNNSLLGVFINGLKDEIKSDVRIHKPRTVYSAMSLALEFESKLATHRPGKNASWTSNSKSFQPDPKPTTFTPIPTSTQPKYTPRIPDTEKQNRFLKGECFRCGDKYEPGHLCKTGTLKINDLKITQDFHPFSLGSADLVLGIQWLATLNTVQANWKELFMIFSIDRKRYKLEGIVTGPQKSFSFQHLVVEPEVIPCIRAPLQPNSVITNRWVYEAGQPILELLIAWCNRHVEEATWGTYDLVAE
nr:retrotransposon Gag domain, retroviral aspartyl protease [Tanacetum cinerariifolium]